MHEQDPHSQNPYAQDAYQRDAYERQVRAQARTLAQARDGHAWDGLAGSGEPRTGYAPDPGANANANINVSANAGAHVGARGFDPDHVTRTLTQRLAPAAARAPAPAPAPVRAHVPAAPADAPAGTTRAAKPSGRSRRSGRRGARQEPSRPWDWEPEREQEPVWELGRRPDPVGDRPSEPSPGRTPDRSPDRLAGRPVARSNRPHRPHRPGDGAGNRLFVLLLFWFMLAGSVALWWFNNPDRSITGTAEILTAVGRITGMIGGFVLIVQVLMMSRVAWVEAWIGAHDLLRWHREMGAYLLVMVLAHVVFTVIGYARTDQVSILSETWTIVTTFEDMISASVATGILVALSLLAIRGIRRRMRYELWHLVHMSGYLVLLLGYGHQFAVGTELSTAGVAQWYWAGLYALVVACLIWGRVVEPLWFNARHRLRVGEVVRESPDMFSIYIEGRRLDQMDVRPGQFFRWRFLNRAGWWQAHPFSLSAAPNRQWLRLTVNEAGDHTSDLRYLRSGTRVLAAGPSGTFTADQRTSPGALLIAGGSGIAPIRALMEEMPPGTVVVYRAGRAEEVVFRDELERLAVQRELRVVYVLGSRDDPRPRRLLTPDGIRALVPDVAGRDVYLCGPQGLVSAMVKTLRKAGVRRRRIHLDPFEF